jgi:hypothetical protein
MRHILAIVVFCLVHTTVLAQAVEAQLPITCAPAGVLLKELKETYKEEPAWLGNSVGDASYMAVFSDPKTGAWTVIKFNTDSACIVGAGIDGRVILVNPI